MAIAVAPPEISAVTRITITKLVIDMVIIIFSVALFFDAYK